MGSSARTHRKPKSHICSKLALGDIRLSILSPSWSINEKPRFEVLGLKFAVSVMVLAAATAKVERIWDE